MRFRHDKNNSWSRLALIIVISRMTTVVVTIRVAGQTIDAKKEEVKEEEMLKKVLSFEYYWNKLHIIDL